MRKQKKRRKGMVRKEVKPWKLRKEREWATMKEGHKAKIGKCALEEAAGRPLFFTIRGGKYKSESRSLVAMN